MEVITKPSNQIYTRLGWQEQVSGPYLPSNYTLDVDVGDGKIIYNTLTCEMIHVRDSEYTPENQYLVRHWFFMPESIDQWSLAYTMRKMYMQSVRRRKIDKIYLYTIMTTMACNARCYYCYEAGRRITTMSEEMAEEVADFIIRTNIGHVSLQWFGGEPLCNSKAIDIISQRLTDAEIAYGAFIVTNAYLLDQYDIKDIVRRWHLERAQITLDGTKEAYNRAKNYVNQDNDAFGKVLDNMEQLVKNGVSVKVRLNLSNDNIDDMHSLIDVLHDRFSGYDNFSVYSHALFDIPNPLADENRHISLQKHLMDAGLWYTSGIGGVLNNHCMADNARSIVITPEGKLTLCEHYSESEYVGDIWHDEFDPEMVRKWQEPLVIPECKTCPRYPQCRIIKCCPVGACTENTREYATFVTEEAMKREYRDWRRHEDNV